MGYYASGGGSIFFSRPLRDDETEKIIDILSDEFEVGFSQEADCIDLWTDGNYHEDGIYRVLDEVTRDFPIESGEIELHGDDECFWKFTYRPDLRETEAVSCWAEQTGSIVYEGDDPQYVYVLLHRWDCDASAGSEVMVFSEDSLALARKTMREEAEKIKTEYRELYGEDPWEKDYTWEGEDEIRLGFDPRGFLSSAVVYSWEISRREVTGT